MRAIAIVIVMARLNIRGISIYIDHSVHDVMSLCTWPVLPTAASSIQSAMGSHSHIQQMQLGKL